MDELISPKYQMWLVSKIDDTLWDEFSSSKYKNVLFYIQKWHQYERDNFNEWENFHICYKNNQSNEIDLVSTLHGMPPEILIKIAIDLWIETPDFIPCVPTFKNDLKEDYKTAFGAFENAFKQAETNPDLAVSLSNATLESIIKHIIKDERVDIEYNENKTLYDLTQSILKAFNLFPNKDAQNEIRAIWNWLLNATKNIEQLRSNKTQSHGKTQDDYIIDNPMYAYFIINSISTIGLFLMRFYKEKYKQIKDEAIQENRNIDISVEDLPF